MRGTRVGMDEPMSMTAIGVVRTDRTATETTPIQSSLNKGEEGRIEIDPAYREGLDGLQGFDYAWLLSWLHRADRSTEASRSLRQVPFLLRAQQREMGIFATRGPRRVNPVGLSLIRLVDVDGGTIRFAGVDLLDGTPVLDIKPYVARFDLPPGNPRCGWFDEITVEDGVTPTDLGPGDRPTRPSESP
jgi:tRNA (adenine37-N6)-methyltransferase